MSLFVAILLASLGQKAVAQDCLAMAIPYQNTNAQEFARFISNQLASRICFELIPATHARSMSMLDSGQVDGFFLVTEELIQKYPNRLVKVEHEMARATGMIVYDAPEGSQKDATFDNMTIGVVEGADWQDSILDKLKHKYQLSDIEKGLRMLEAGRLDGVLVAKETWYQIKHLFPGRREMTFVDIRVFMVLHERHRAKAVEISTVMQEWEGKNGRFQDVFRKLNDDRNAKNR